MCKCPPTIRAAADPVFRRVTGRSAGCWMWSHWMIAKEFEAVLNNPGTTPFVLGIVIHGYLLAEFPLMYEKAFFAWKWNFGFRLVDDDGYNEIAPYPISPQWVDDFRRSSFFWAREAGNQPNGCLCGVGVRDFQPCPHWP